MVLTLFASWFLLTSVQLRSKTRLHNHPLAKSHISVLQDGNCCVKKLKVMWNECWKRKCTSGRSSSVGKGIWHFWKSAWWGCCLLSLQQEFSWYPHLCQHLGLVFQLFLVLCAAVFLQLRCLALMPCWTWPCTLPGPSCLCPVLLLGASCQTSQPLSDSDVWGSLVQRMRNGGYSKIKKTLKAQISLHPSWPFSSRAIFASCCVLRLLSLLLPVALESFPFPILPIVAHSSLCWNGKCLGRFGPCHALSSLCCF